MVNFEHERRAAQTNTFKCFDWTKPGQICIPIRAGQFFDRKSEWWDYPEKRLQMQLARLEQNVKFGCGNFPILLVDYGDIIVPSMFGASIADLDGGPWLPPVLRNIKEHKNLPQPSFNTALGTHFLKTMEYFLEHCPRGVAIVPPHKITPFGNAMLLRGTDIYLDLYDNPQEAHELLKKVTEAIILCFETIYAKLGLPIQAGITPNGFPIPAIFFGDDSSINLGQDHIWEFDLRYVELLSRHFHSPVFLHYCVLNPSQGLQLLAAYAQADFVSGLANQYEPPFFFENYDKFFKNRLFLATETPLDKLGKTQPERLQNFKNMLALIKNRMPDKAGLLYFTDARPEEVGDFVKLRNETIK